MTNDIVERLRLLVASDSTGASIEAIAEIIRLRTQNAELVAALRQIVGHKYAEYGIRRIARAAIAKAEGGRDV